MKSQILSLRDLNRALLARQMLLAREKVSIAQAISRLIGLQAQQPQPAFVGLWTRVAGFKRHALLRLFESRDVVRATLMRCTLHVILTDDFISLRSTLQPALTAAMRSILRDRAKAFDISAITEAARSLFMESPRTFTEVRSAISHQFPGLDERALGYAVRTHLPLITVPVDSDWGFCADAEFMDAALWLGRSLDAEERPQDLILRYLAAFGPATPADFQTWSGLSGTRVLFDSLRSSLHTFRDVRNRELFDLPDAPRPLADSPAPVRFLPGFDNVILSHADRTRIITDEHRSRVTTRNLQVLPTFLVDGFVAGTWKYTCNRDTVTLTVSPFSRIPKEVKENLSNEAKLLVHFLAPDVGTWTIRFENA